MFRIPATVAICAVLTACAPITSQEELDAQQALAARQCDGPSRDGCLFINSPVRLGNEKVRVASRQADFFPTADRLEFIDVDRRRWIAPERTLTDGASIPRIFIPIVGSPTSQEFVNAAAVHDAYCGIGNEAGPEFHAARWQDVHRMFYDALRVGGTPEGRAKLLFAAVYLGGPRWNDPGRSLDTIPEAYMKQAMEKTKTFIETEQPSLPKLIAYIDWLERGLTDKWVPKNEEDKQSDRPVLRQPYEVEEVEEELLLDQ